MFTGCDVFAHEADPTAVSAEKAAVLAAVAAGTGNFQVRASPLQWIALYCTRHSGPDISTVVNVTIISQFAKTGYWVGNNSYDSFVCFSVWS